MFTIFHNQRNFFADCGKFSGKVRKSTLSVSRGTYGKFVLLRLKIPNNFWDWANPFRNFVETFSAGLSKVNFSCPEEHLEERGISIGKKIGRTILVFSDNVSSKFFKIVFYLCRINFQKFLRWNKKGRDITERWGKLFPTAKIYCGRLFDVSESFCVQRFMRNGGILTFRQKSDVSLSH